VRHHYVDLFSTFVPFVVIRRKKNLLFFGRLLLEYSARGNGGATHASVYYRCPTVLDVLPHVVISLAVPSASSLAAIVNDRSGLGNIVSRLVKSP
jgi:hypothetical protein